MPRDLFDIFPDLPWPRQRSVFSGVESVRARAELARRRMVVAIARHQRTAGLVRAAWRRQVRLLQAK
jgi:hypothetical protein